MGRYSFDTSFRLSASIAFAGLRRIAASAHPRWWLAGIAGLSRVVLDKYAGVAHPEITGYSGKGSSEVTL